MDFKLEFHEYKKIYDIYFESFQDIQQKTAEKTKQILAKDKEDIEMQHESTEKMDMLTDYMFYIYKSNLILNDLSKIAERLSYISELSIRTNTDLELSEENKKFMDNLKIHTASAYVVENSTITAKVQGLDEIIRKKVDDEKEKKYLHLDALRKSAG